MAINIFKKEKKTEAKKEVAKKEPKQKKASSETRNWNILKSPSITEKASNMTSQGNFYVFIVDDDSNKKQIKTEIESKYKVNVLSVRTVNVHRKKVRRGRTEGFKNGYKKAIIKLKEGEKIEIAGK